MRLKTKLVMLKGLITKRTPVYVQFAVSKYCNLTCRKCQAAISRKNERELDLKEIDRLAGILEKLSVGIVVLSGGEPLLREDIADVVRIFTGKGFTVRMQTNGQLATEEKVKELIRAGLREVTLSLDTLESEKQDWINNCAGSWEKTIQAIAIFSKLLPVKGNVIGVNTVVSKLNIEEIPSIVEFITSMGLYSSLIPIHISSDNNTDFIIRRNAPEFKLPESDSGLIDKIYEKLINMKKKRYHIHNSFKFLKESREFLKYGRISWPCDSPYLYFSISPEGYFLPCVDLKGTKSILDNDFLEVFRSNAFKNNIRNEVRNCPGCFYACYPEISFFCRDFYTAFERLWQGCEIYRTVRKPASYEDCLTIIDKIKKGNLAYEGSINQA
jgi:AdoMet-dependent heme synthase